MKLTSTKSHTYGVNTRGGYVDVSRTERGAKNYATRHGYNEIHIRYDSGCIIQFIARRSGKKWVAPILSNEDDQL